VNWTEDGVGGGIGLVGGMAVGVEIGVRVDLMMAMATSSYRARNFIRLRRKRGYSLSV